MSRSFSIRRSTPSISTGSRYVPGLPGASAGWEDFGERQPQRVEETGENWGCFGCSRRSTIRAWPRACSIRPPNGCGHGVAHRCLGQSITRTIIRAVCLSMVSRHGAALHDEPSPVLLRATAHCRTGWRSRRTSTHGGLSIRTTFSPSGDVLRNGPPDDTRSPSARSGARSSTPTSVVVRRSITASRKTRGPTHG